MNISSTEIGDKLADALNRVAYSGERIILERRGKAVAALVSMDDLKFLEEIEDRADLKAARKALAQGGKAVPLEKVIRELAANTVKPRRVARK